MPEELEPLDERSVLISQVKAMRAQCDAMLVLLEGAVEETTCLHPEGQRQYLPGTMGSPRRFTCQACNETVTEKPSAPIEGAGA